MQQNPRKLFSQVYDRHIDKIYRFVLLKVNSQEVAEDLTAETFKRFWDRLSLCSEVGNPQPKIENPRAFLYQIARNLVIDHYRKKGKIQIISAEYTQIIDPRINLEKKAVLESDIDTIRLALVNLKESYQDVIIWYYLDELAVPEIAGILDKSENTIRVTIHRALEALRREMNSNTAEK